jgi:threonine synthase
MTQPVSRLVCGTCAAEFAESDARLRCECGGLLEVHHQAPKVTGAGLRALFDGRRGAPRGPFASGVWRFREIVLPSAPDDVLTYPEGNTPLVERGQVSSWADGTVLLKHEGHNPTASFKDRGMTVGVTHARRLGVPAVACASTGNTGASLGAYAALAGLPALALVPVGHVAQGKLSQLLAYGVHTLVVRGDFDACQRLAHEAAAQLGVYLLNSVNPFRLEGQKAIVLELLQQLDWDPPDWIVVPAGNLGNTAAFGKALREACEWGLISRVPRLAAVQAAGAAPFAQSFREGFARRHRVTAETVASAIRVGDPASYDRAVRAIRETNGVVTTVTDDEILEAKTIIDTAGVGCEPASAASVAGTRRLRGEGVIARGARVVAVLTGHLLKDPAIAGPNRPVEIDAKLSAIESVLRSSAPGGSPRNR